MKRRELDVDVVLWESLATPSALMNSEAPNKGELVGLSWRWRGALLLVNHDDDLCLNLQH
jgi:hypothetical protein